MESQKKLAEMATDKEFEEYTLTRVDGTAENGWSVVGQHGWGFFVPPGSIVPRVGSVARLYGKGLGYPFRGMVIDGQCVFYRNEAENSEYQSALTFGRDAADLLSRWDAGRSVWSVEMGGLGPGYEQALQLAMFEVLRVWVGSNVNLEEWDKVRAETEQRVFPVVESLGLSGAQWGAALHLAARMYRDGPKAVHNSVKADRQIQVSRHFPTLPIPASAPPSEEQASAAPPGA